MKENKKKLGKSAGMELDEAQIGNVSGGTGLKEGLNMALDAADDYVNKLGGVEGVIDKGLELLNKGGEAAKNALNKQ